MSNNSKQSSQPLDTDFIPPNECDVFELQKLILEFDSWFQLPFYPSLSEIVLGDENDSSRARRPDRSGLNEAPRAGRTILP